MTFIPKGSEIHIGVTQSQVPAASVFSAPVLLKGGGMVVGWQSTFDGATHLRMVDKAGVLQGSEIIVGDRYGAINDIIAFKGGGFATFYSSIVGGSSRELSMQKFNNDGSLDGDAKAIITPVADAKFGGLPSNMNVTQLENGNFLMTWEIPDKRDGASFDQISVRGQIFDTDGQTIGKVRDMFAGANSAQRDSEVTATKDGGYILTWRENTGIVNGNDIFVQKFNAKGKPVSGSKMANTDVLGEDSDPVVTELSNGKFVVTWWGGFNVDGDSWGVFAQMFNKNGSKAGDQFQVNTNTSSQQWAPDIEALPDGGFIVTWQSFTFEDEVGGQHGSGAEIIAQRFDSKGQPIGTEFQVNTSDGASQWYSSIDVADDGSFAVSWQSHHLGGDKWQIMTQQFEAQTYGNAGNNRIRDKAGADWVDGLDGNDRIFGLKGNDKLYGGTGNDLLNGGVGKDKLFGGSGNDDLRGGGGKDLLKGEAGDDILNGGKGADKLYGGKGTDTFVFKAGVDGKDKIFGFDAGEDSIKISNGSDVTVSNANGNTLIEYDGADGSILLKGVVLAEADISFEFV